MKLLKIFRALFIVFLIISVVFVSLLIQQYNQKRNWQEISAQYNYHHWDELYLISEKLENSGISKETVFELYSYLNAKVYSCTQGLYPVFKGDSKYTSFLGTYYVSLAQSIAMDDLTEDRLYEAIRLFDSTNSDLKKLCKNILDMAETTEGKLALMETDSQLYKRAESMVKSFCNEKGEEISNFNMGLNTTPEKIVVNEEFGYEGFAVFVKNVRLYSERTDIECVIKSTSIEAPFSGFETYIDGNRKRYNYLEGDGVIRNGETDYIFSFEPLENEKSITVYIGLRGGDSNTFNLNLE